MSTGGLFPTEITPKSGRVARGDLRFYRNCLQNIQKSIRQRDGSEVENAADNDRHAAFTGSQQLRNNKSAQSVADFPATADLQSIGFKISPHQTNSAAESLACLSIAVSNASIAAMKRVTFQTAPTIATFHTDTAVSIKDAHSVPMNPVFVSPRAVGTSGGNFSFAGHIDYRYDCLT